jgi:hypothetical protein
MHLFSQGFQRMSGDVAHLPMNRRQIWVSAERIKGGGRHDEATRYGRLTEYSDFPIES